MQFVRGSNVVVRPGVDDVEQTDHPNDTGGFDTHPSLPGIRAMLATPGPAPVAESSRQVVHRERSARWSGTAAGATATPTACRRRGSAGTGDGDGGQQLDRVGVAVRARRGRRGGTHRPRQLEGDLAVAAAVLITGHPTSVGQIHQGDGVGGRRRMTVLAIIRRCGLMRCPGAGSGRVRGSQRRRCWPAVRGRGRRARVRAAPGRW